jgi:nitrous oxide reductase
MCAGEDDNCPQFDLHRQELLDSLDSERRGFLKGAFAATSGAAALTTGGALLSSSAAAQTVAARQGQTQPPLSPRHG